MDTVLCQRETRVGRLVAVALAAAALAAAQPGGSPSPDWRRIGNTAVEVSLASPATGAVDRVWFSPDGATLYAHTVSGRVLETADGEAWRPSDQTEPVKTAEPYAGIRLPRGASRFLPHPGVRGRGFALGADLYRSEDGGRSWTNLTAFSGESIIGAPQHDLAVSPRDPDVLVVANDFGVWRSADGGLSWSGLNQFLPNLPVRRILAAPEGLLGARAAVEGYGVLEQRPGSGKEWFVAADASLDREAAERRTVSDQLGAEITALGASGDIRYAGAIDGRLWVSADRGRSWRPSPPMTTSRIERIAVDPREPRVALAAVAGRGPRVLRTTNTGVYWDDLSANLPDAPAHAVAFDRAERAAYVATDRGVYYAPADLDGPGVPSPWTALTDGLPRAAATDVTLGSGGNQLYVALDGWGVFATGAPHRAGRIRLANAADFSARPAAPGSLLSVLGGKINRASAGSLSFPVLAATEAESQIQVPFEAAGPSVALALEASGRSVSLPLAIDRVSPAIFIDRDGAPMVLDADSGLMLEAGSTARAGARIQILATGLGRVRPDWPTGLAAPLKDPPAVAAAVSVSLDRTVLPAARATLAPGYIGFYVIEFTVPAVVNAGPAELYLDVDGRESNRVRLVLEP